MTELEDGASRDARLRTVIARVQAEVRGYIPDDVELTDELLAERRQEGRDHIPPAGSS